MVNYLKNPIILAIIVGSVAYVLMCYFYNTSNSTEKSDKSKKGSKSKKKKKVGFFTDKRETCILISSILALGTWFLAKTYLCQNNSASIVDIRGLQSDPNLIQQQNSFLGVNHLIGHELGNLNTGQVVQNVPTTMQTNPLDMQANQVNPTNQVNQIVMQSNPGIVQGNQGNQGNVPTLIANPVTVPSNVVPQVAQNVQVGGAINKSYNLIGTGLDIPRSAIPKVLVDYH
jgi:hypothetical protein